MVQRFDEQVNLAFSSPQTGAAQGVMGLSQKFEQIRNRKMQEGAQKIADQQFQEGVRGFKKGEAPQFKDEGAFIGGASAKAYNKGLKASYMASLSNDVREDLARFERENPADSQAFANATNAHREALAAQVDPVVLPELMSRYDDAVSRANVRVQDKEFHLERQMQINAVNKAVASAGDDAGRLARMGDTDSAMASLRDARDHLAQAVDAEILTQGEADAALAGIQKEAIEQENRFNFETIADTKGFDAAYAELDRIAGKPPGNYTADEWAGYIKDQQAELARKERRQADEAAASKADIAKAEAFDDITRRLAGDERVVMNDKFVDEYFVERVQPLVSMMPAEERDAMVANYIDKTKVVPATVSAQVTNNIRSGNPELIAESSEFAARLDNIPGVSDDVANPNERAYAKLVSDLMANMEPDEATRIAFEATNPKDQARIAAVDEQIKEKFKGFGSSSESEWYKEQASDTFSSFWSADPDMDPMQVDQMGKEWGDAWKAYRRAGMDEEAAKEAAGGVIKRNWSEFNGQVVKYSPSVYYSAPDGDNEFIMDQLAADINESSLEQIPRERIRIISDDRTSRTAAKGQPDYGIVVELENGELFRYPPSFRWAPDLQSELERRESENAVEAAERRRRAGKSTAEAVGEVFVGF